MIFCDVVSLRCRLFSGKVRMLVASGRCGDLNILPKHAPLLTFLDEGPVRLYLESGGKEVFHVYGGFLEVQPSKVLIFVDEGIQAELLDEEQILAEKRRVEKLLSGYKVSDKLYITTLVKLRSLSACLKTLQVLRTKSGYRR